MGYVREKGYFVFKCKKFGELDEKPSEIKEIKVVGKYFRLAEFEDK